MQRNFNLLQFGFQILSALGTESCRPSSAAQCVAYVAVVELPVDQWNELIPHLVENVVSPNSTELKKEASLEAIGNTIIVAEYNQRHDCHVAAILRLIFSFFRIYLSRHKL